MNEVTGIVKKVEKTARLRILEIDMPIGLFDIFHDDGFVNSIPEQRRRVYTEYGFRMDQENLQCLAGLTIHHNIRFHDSRFNRKICHIFYKDVGDEFANAYLRAHEETHALDFFGRLDLLERKILSDSGICVDFGNIEDKEVKANIGAIHALAIRGFSLERDSGDSSYPPAFDIYFGREIAKTYFLSEKFIYEKSRGLSIQ